MLKFFTLVCLSGIFYYTGGKEEKIKQKVIDDIFLVIPNESKIDSNRIYNNIEIFEDNVLLFKDTIKDYIFINNLFPFGRRLKNGTYEVLLKTYGGYQYDNIWALYIKDYKLLQRQKFPDFREKCNFSRFDRNTILSGILSISESPCGNCDSCYYNPILFYRFGENGIYLDSTLTKLKNKEHCGGFYGFYLTEKVILPCKR